MSTQYLRISPRGGGNRRRSTPLERLLANAERLAPTDDWRAEAFEVLMPSPGGLPGVGACAWWADGGPHSDARQSDDAWIMLASPVRYAAEMNNVRLPLDGLLRLHEAQAGALAADFNRIWNDGVSRMLAGRAGNLYCVFPHALDVRTVDPADVLGGHLESHLPSGADSPRLRRLMSEIEMWLHDHEMNRRRVALGLPVLSGLWLWGGGPLLRSLPAVSGWVCGNDPLFDAFASAPGHGAGVAVIDAQPGGEAWERVAASRIETAIEDLRRGHIAELRISAGQHRFTVGARWRRRFWRRTHPWWEYLA